MGDSRHPKDYVEGPRKQMTLTWKQCVLKTLADNEAAGVEPSNLAELARAIGADKRGIYVTFDLDAEKPQMSSAYVDKICNVLGIDPPLQEPIDDEFARELDEIRQMPPEEQQHLLDLIRLWRKK